MLWSYETDTVPLTASAPHSEAEAPRMPGKGLLQDFLAVLATPQPEWVPMSENLSAWSGHGGCGWQIASSGPLCCLPASTPCLPSSWDPRWTHQGQGGGADRAEDDSGPSCHQGNPVA